jgi:predicted aspartyl protease
MTIPAPVVGHALIDTGAFATAVDERVFQELGIPLIDTMQTNTPHGPATSNVYPANISFPALELTNLPLERVIGANLRWKTPDGKEIIMLLGRDLLKYFLLVYNGKSFDITLAY